VIHSYRHRIRNAAGDPRYVSIEAQLATLPKISVPTIVIHGADDEVNPPHKSEGHHRFFTGYYERRLFEKVGHNPECGLCAAFANFRWRSFASC
jgi:pimeloyl-ACP methyl ester carboxylesterase